MQATAEAQVVRSSTPGPLGKRPAPLDLKYFQGLIQQKKAEVENRVAEIRQKLTASPQFFGLTHAADFNPPLSQTDHWGLANAQKILQRSREALERLRIGTYGICLNCRMPIDIRRLQVVPHTRFCVHCKNGGNDD